MRSLTSGGALTVLVMLAGTAKADGPTMRTTMLTKILTGAVLATLAMSGAAGAQQLPVATQQTATIKRTPLQKFDVPGTNYETVIGIAEIVPNLNIGRHTHPGPESGYMLEGEMVLLVNGQPEKTVRVGESYQVPSGAIHDARTGPQGAKVIATYVVEKGKALASPAP
jgi:quercetin dioxygenase-like cupin family protein